MNVLALFVALALTAATGADPGYDLTDMGPVPGSAFRITDIGPTRGDAATGPVRPSKSGAADALPVGPRHGDVSTASGTGPTSGAAGAVPAAASTAGPPETTPPVEPTPGGGGTVEPDGYTVTDVTGDGADGFWISDLGPAADARRDDSAGDSTTQDPDAEAALAPPTANPTAPALPTTRADQGETWVAKPGDHLWDIAAQTVARRGGTGAADPTATAQAVLRYWYRLLEANADTLADSPGMIYPGQVIVLPD